jgi:hypothetical protein
MFSFAHSDETVAGLAAVLLHTSKEKHPSTIIIQGVAVTNRMFVATDRFSVARYAHGDPAGATTESEATVESETVVIPLDVAVWLSKLTLKSLGWIVVTEPASPYTVDVDAERVSVRRGDTVVAQRVFERVGGNFPPAARLFDGVVPAADGSVPVHLNAMFVERFVKAAKLLSQRGVPPLMELTLTKTDNPNKPGPVLFRIGDRFDGLLQPNLILR